MHTAGLLLISFFFAFPAFASGNGAKSPALGPAILTPEQKLLHEAKPPSGSDSIELRAWLNHKNGRYRPGDAVSLYLRSDRDAYITVLDIGTSGKTHVIFPNEFEPNNRLTAFSTLEIPGKGQNYHIKVGGPAGTELLKIFASSSSKPLIPAAILQKAGPYKRVEMSAKSIAKTLHSAMMATSKSPGLSMVEVDQSKDPKNLENRQNSRTGRTSRATTVFGSIEAVIQIITRRKDY